MGPWAAGYLDSSGLQSYGVLSLVGATVAALAIWRWTISRRSSLLLFIGMVSSIVISTVIYALNRDVYEPYVEAGDTWLNYVGWGLILVLLAAVVLAVLCVRGYLRDGSAKLRANWPTAIGLLSLAPLVALGLWVGSVESEEPRPERRLLPEASEPPIPGYALKLAGAKAEDTTWGVWLFGNTQGEHCVGSATEERVVGHEKPRGNIEESYCEPKIPAGHWEQIAEGPLRDSTVAFVFVARPSVGVLQVITSDVSDPKSGIAKHRVDLALVTENDVRRARLSQDIAYGVAEVSKQACVRRVVALNRDGRRIKATPTGSCSVAVSPAPWEAE